MWWWLLYELELWIPASPEINARYLALAPWWPWLHWGLPEQRGVSPFYPGWKHCWTSEGNTVPPNRGGSHWHHILHPGARQLFFFTGTGDSEPTQLSFLPEEHTDRTLPETSLLRIQCPIFSPSVLKEIGPGGIFFFICLILFILFPLEWGLRFSLCFYISFSLFSFIIFIFWLRNLFFFFFEIRL